MKTKHLIIRWSFVTSGLTALFWMIYRLTVGNVPIVTSIQVFPPDGIVLPFGISRWWDILIGPIWSTVIILLRDELNDEFDKEKNTRNLVGGSLCGLVAGLILFIPTSIIPSPIPTTISFLLIISVGSIFDENLIPRSTVTLARLIFALFCAIRFGLIFGLIFVLLELLIKLITSDTFWDFMLAKNK